VESEQPRPGDPCSPNGGACTCWLRPEDRALLLDCASRNLTRPPEWIDARAVAKVELDLRINELKEPPSMYKKGYEKVTSLNLAKNRISVVDERLLSPNLKVPTYTVPTCTLNCLHMILRKHSFLFYIAFDCF
jgi:hypothetical protein